MTVPAEIKIRKAQLKSFISKIKEMLFESERELDNLDKIFPEKEKKLTPDQELFEKYKKLI